MNAAHERPSDDKLGAALLACVVALVLACVIANVTGLRGCAEERYADVFDGIVLALSSSASSSHDLATSSDAASAVEQPRAGATEDAGVEPASESADADALAG